MHTGLATQRLVAVFLVAVLVFNYPIVSLFDRPEPLVGVPALYLAIFAAWGVVIAAMAWIVERGSR